MDSFRGSVVTMEIDLSVIKSTFNKFYVVIYKLNVAKENLSNLSNQETRPLLGLGSCDILKHFCSIF